jgi:hypothetical protein
MRLVSSLKMNMELCVFNRLMKRLHPIWCLSVEEYNLLMNTGLLGQDDKKFAHFLIF